MLHIGYHESTSNGYAALATEAISVGADTFAFFTRNPRGGKSKPLDKDDVKLLNKIMKENNFAPIVAHAPYTMNPCSSDEGLRNYALEMMIDDLIKLEQIDNVLYNFHPGSHTGQGTDVGIKHTSTLIFDSIEIATKSLQKLPSTVLLIETMAGKGSEIGKTFEEVHAIIEEAESKASCSLESNLGVCLDTCHIWDGGYDIVNNLDYVIEQFDKIIGLNRLKAIHLNDSMNDRDTHKDRHQKIGEGFIGFDTLKAVTRHPAFCNLPFILETPNEHDGYKKEIEMLKSEK